MTDDEIARLKRLGRDYHKTNERAAALRKQLREALIDAKTGGMRTIDISRYSGYDREMVRRIVRNAKKTEQHEEGQA